MSVLIPEPPKKMGARSPKRMSDCFKKQQRLLTKHDYDAVFKQAFKQRGNYFTFFYRRISSGVSRLGIVVAKRNVPRAVDRNRLKRVMREIFRHLPLASPVELVIVAQKGAGQLSKQTLHQLLQTACLKILKPETGTSS